MTVTGVPKYNNIRESALAASVSVYPNPSHGIFTIEGGAALQGARITIVNTLGQTVKDFTMSQGSVQQQLPSGFYLLHFSKEGQQFTKKLMIE
ncbi:MAG: T9SS type A sorting domain-containing protein [Chitinophagaceae bacterium]